LVVECHIGPFRLTDGTIEETAASGLYPRASGKQEPEQTALRCSDLLHIVPRTFRAILCAMSIEPLESLLTSLRATLRKLERASKPSEDGPALADLKQVLRVRIAALEIALRL
jgi:hypothetical protein